LSRQWTRAPGFAALSDEATSLILSYLPLRSPFLLQQCSQLQRNDLRSRSQLFWTCISEFVSVQALRADVACGAACSLFQWASRIASQVSALDDDLLASPSEEKQVTYEICLDGSVALGMSRSYLAAACFQAKDVQTVIEDGGARRPFAQTAANMAREVLEGAECRLCRRSSTGFRSEGPEGSGGHTNKYEAEFLIPANHSGAHDQLRLGINVCKYYSEGAYGWDEGLDVNCYVDGREILTLRRDGSDSEYDAHSVSRGALQQLAAQMLVPASDTMAVLAMLWQILCAPLLACSRWDEKMPRFGLGLPHRNDEPAMFHTLGSMFAKLSDSVAGTSVDSSIKGQNHGQDAATSRFLRFVLEK